MPANPGLSPEVQAAIQRRQGAQPALNQVSPGAASATGIPAPTSQSDMTQASAPSGQAPSMPKFEPQDRIDLITVALVEQMKNDAKLEKEKGKVARGETQSPPPAPAPAPAPQAPQGGGTGMFNQPMPRSKMQGDYTGLSGYGS